jgi:hypothetical protein
MKRPTAWLLGAVALLFITPSDPLMAQCMECKVPPPYTTVQCGNTFYNAADGCLISQSGTVCQHIGTCTGNAGDPCSLRCPLEKWACDSRPLSEEWRLVRVAVQVAPIEPASSSEADGSV